MSPYDARVPPTWRIAMVVLVVCLLASIVIALVKLL
jgi:Na+-transporting NADH:ubiquinone oxidoreductase subunit NqrC